MHRTTDKLERFLYLSVDLKRLSAARTVGVFDHRWFDIDPNGRTGDLERTAQKIGESFPPL